MMAATPGITQDTVIQYWALTEAATVIELLYLFIDSYQVYSGVINDSNIAHCNYTF